MSWTCALGWLLFTVPEATADEAMKLVGGDWIADEKGFQGYSQGWLSRGNAGGLGRIGTGAKRAPREVHVDLSQELISGWSYEQFQSVTAWVLAKEGHFGRIDVALDDRSGLIDVDRIYASVVAGNCVSHFRQYRLIAGLDLGCGVVPPSYLELIGNRVSSGKVVPRDRIELSTPAFSGLCSAN